MQCLLLDFTDTFWQIPLARAERKKIVGFDGKYLVDVQPVCTGEQRPVDVGRTLVALRRTLGVPAPTLPARAQLYVDPTFSMRDPDALCDDVSVSSRRSWVSVRATKPKEGNISCGSH